MTEKRMYALQGKTGIIRSFVASLCNESTTLAKRGASPFARAAATHLPYGIPAVALLALCVVAVSSPVWAADRAITSDYTLTSDETVDGTLTVAPGVTVDLNGHNLTVSALAGGGNSLIGGRYQILGYLTANRSQYVMSDYTPLASDRVVMKFRFADNSKVYQFLFCTRLPNSKQSFTLLRNNSNTANVRIDHGGNQKSANLSLTGGKDYLIVMNGGAGNAAANVPADGTGVGVAFTTDPVAAPPSPFVLLSDGQYDATGTTFAEDSNYRCKGNFYWFKVNGSDGALKCLIVPAKDTKGTADESDDEIGMYNLVSGTFLPPAAGTFTGGGEYAGEGGRIVNTSATLSELRMNVASGATVESDAVSIAGNVKLVKVGDGTLVASQFWQTYAGGTDVAEGVLKAGTFGNCQPFGLCNDNLLFNGSFDAGAITNGSSFMYAFSTKWPENPGWTCDGHNAGISTANGTWVDRSIDVGKYAMYLRSDGTDATVGAAHAEQTFRIADPGHYRFSFTYMAVPNNSRKGATLQVNLIHAGVTNMTVNLGAVSSAARQSYSRRVEITEAGEYTLQFFQAAGSKYLANSIDDVVFAPVLEENNLLRNGSFDEGSISDNGGKFQYASSTEWTENPHWTCDGVNVGLSTDNTWAVPGTLVGKYSAYLRTQANGGDAWFEQTMRIDDPGAYALWFTCSICANSSRRNEPFHVLLIHNGETNHVMSVTANDDSFRYYGKVVEITEPGDWTLQFRQYETSTVRSSNINDVYFGRVPQVIVREGATFDVAGQRMYGKYPLVMDGGTFVNSGARGTHDAADSLLGTVLLSKDSLFALTNSYAMRAYEYGILGQSRMNLGGHELDIKLLNDHFYIENCTITNGSIKVSEETGNNHYLCFIHGNTDATGVDLTLKTSSMLADVTGIRNLTFTDPDTTHFNTKTFYVSGTLKCLLPNFPNIRLADGATLDLSENTGTFSLNGTPDARTISFEDGATIALKLGDRRAKSKIVGWTTEPANLDTLTFVRSPEVASRRYWIEKRSDGIYICTGMMIIVR